MKYTLKDFLFAGLGVAVMLFMLAFFITVLGG